MINNGFKRMNTCACVDIDDQQEQQVDWRYQINNNQLFEITGARSLIEYFENTQKNWIGYVIRRENNSIIKSLTFTEIQNMKQGRPVTSIIDRTITT